MVKWTEAQAGSFADTPATQGPRHLPAACVSPYNQGNQERSSSGAFDF